MNTEELDEIEARAEANARAFIRMDELNGGVGLLGVKEPEMLEDLARWDDSTDNDHADTVLALVAEVRRLRAEHVTDQTMLDSLFGDRDVRDDHIAALTEERDALQEKLDQVRAWLDEPGDVDESIGELVAILDGDSEVES